MGPLFMDHHDDPSSQEHLQPPPDLHEYRETESGPCSRQDDWYIVNGYYAIKKE